MESKNVVKQRRNNKEGGITGKGFKKGKSGNPHGRPRKQFCIPDILNKLLQEKSIYSPDGATNLDMICQKAIQQAQGGDKDARNWVADRSEGKAVERILKQKVYDEIVINPKKEG